jgi:ABC-type Mn2+/Zn2+ transport system ATPase subunit
VSEDEWLTQLADELRTSGVAAEVATQVVAEAYAHVREAGGSPGQVFGTPEGYARAVAASLDVGLPGDHREPATAGAAPGPVRLAVRAVSKAYGRRDVLRDVDLTVRAGEVAAVVGANGSGKSTLLRICVGMVAPDRGEVLVAGTLGYCPQETGLVDFLLPDEHFVLFGTGRNLTRARARSAGHALSNALSWEPGAQTLARDLSGGTRQKLNVVLANIGEPDVLLLDEPYQGLDRGTYLDFWEIVWRWRDAGKAIVVVTHMLNHLDRVDTVLELPPALAGDRAA